MVFGREQNANPLPEGRGPYPNIHCDVQHFTLHHPAQLGLRVSELIVQTAQHSARRARMIVLYELVLDASVLQHISAIGFHEKATRVFVDSRPDHEHAG